MVDAATCISSRSHGDADLLLGSGVGTPSVRSVRCAVEGSKDVLLGRFNEAELRKETELIRCSPDSGNRSVFHPVRLHLRDLELLAGRFEIVELPFVCSCGGVPRGDHLVLGQERFRSRCEILERLRHRPYVIGDRFTAVEWLRPLTMDDIRDSKFHERLSVLLGDSVARTLSRFRVALGCCWHSSPLRCVTRQFLSFAVLYYDSVLSARPRYAPDKNRYYYTALFGKSEILPVVSESVTSFLMVVGEFVR